MDPETPEALDPWLGQFAATSRPLVRAWFASAASQGAETTDGLLQIVERVVSHTLDRSPTPQTRQVCRVVLLARCHQRSGARGYAATFVPHVRKEAATPRRTAPPF